MSNRAFRISFDEKVSKFVIEIQGFLGMTWKPAKDANKVRYFETFEAAGSFVKEIGLDRIYDDFTLKAPFGAYRPTRQGPAMPPPMNPNVKPLPPQNEFFGYRAPTWNVPSETYPLTKEQAA